MPICVHAANTVYFDTSDVGLDKTVLEWGIDTAWASEYNMRQSIVSFASVDNVDTVRITFHEFESLETDGSLGPSSKAAVDYAAGLAKMPGIKPISLAPDTANGTNAYYLDPVEGVYSDRYAALIIATAQYLWDQHGLTVEAVEVWNEPDYWPGQPTGSQVHEIIAILKSDPLLANAEMVGASTLSPNTWWYDQIKSSLDKGSTHKLGGSATDYVNFIQHVWANGDAFYNPEIHSMAEMLIGAEYGMQGAIFWADSLNPRGKLVQALDGGRRLGYAQNLSDETAAAVYRAADGNLRAYAGGFERSGSDTYYRLVCTDRDVYFDGVGPIREYMVKARGQETQGTYVDIEYGSDAIGLGNSFEGNRWMLVNRQTGKVLQVSGGSTSNGGIVNMATDTGALYQRWDITRSDQVYYALYNANSGLTMDVSNCSMDDDANVQQWGTADNLCQQWTMESAGDGYFYLLNGNSGKYLTGSTIQAYQGSLTGSSLQQWQFVLANPAVGGTPAAYYEFEGNVDDSAGTNDGTATGSPSYTTGRIGQAIDLDGTNDYVTLPSGIVNTDDITVAAWINWDGGGGWQRIFDFGNDTDSYMFLTPDAGDDTMRFAITTGSNTAEVVLVTDRLPIGQWVHVAVTLGSNTGILYIDGTPRVAGRILLNPSDINPVNNYIGQSQWPDPLFDGRIDDFRIYDYALSEAEIDALSQPPSFTIDPIENLDAIELEPYSGQSLADYVDVPTDGLTFSKESGPDWLVAASDGTLSGIPISSDAGENIFTVRVENQAGIFDTATMTIQVANTYSGVLGTTDLAGLAAEWLTLDCGTCNGADLDGDHDVTFSDFSIQAYNWLADESLQLHLKFDETSGTIASDSSIYHRSGQFVGSPVWDTGHVGGALSFDGVDDYVEVPGYKGITGGASRTCTAWIKAPDSSDEILSWGDLEYGGKWIIRINETGTLRAEVQGGYIYGSTVINDDAWHHIAVILDSDGTPDISEVLLYVDGQLETPAAVSARSIDTSATQDVAIGVHYSSSRYFLGLIDDVRIYNVALSEEEVLSLSQ